MRKNNEIDALMRMMLLHELMKDDGMKISPFTVSIEVTPVSISSHSEGNKKLIKDLGAEEWLKETQERIEPIIKEQTTKFAELFKKKFGCEMSDATEETHDFIKDLFGGGIGGRRLAYL